MAIVLPYFILTILILIIRYRQQYGHIGPYGNIAISEIMDIDSNIAFAILTILQYGQYAIPYMVHV